MLDLKPKSASRAAKRCRIANLALLLGACAHPLASQPAAEPPAAQAQWFFEDNAPTTSACFGVEGQACQIAVLCRVARQTVTINLPLEGAPDRQMPLRFVFADQTFELPAVTTDIGGGLISTAIYGEDPEAWAKLRVLARAQERFSVAIENERRDFVWDDGVARTLAACGVQPASEGAQ